MNNFNSVFAAVKWHLQEKETLSGVEDLQQIAAKAGIPADRLDFYLGSIRDIGLIHYSYPDKKVSLTAKGVEAEYVFAATSES